MSLLKCFGRVRFFTGRIRHSFERRLSIANRHRDDLVPLFIQAGTGTPYNYRYSRYCATLKPNDLPDRAGHGRPLDNFELLSPRSVWDASDNKKNKKQFQHAPLSRHSSGELHHGTST